MKRPVLLAVAAALAAAVFSAMVSGVNYRGSETFVPSYSETGYSGYETETFYPSGPDGGSDGVTFFELSDGNVSPSGDSSGAKIRRIGEIPSVWGIMPTEGTGDGFTAVTVDLKEQKIRTNTAKVLVFGLGIVEQDGASFGYPVSVTMKTSDGVYVSSSYVDGLTQAERFSVIRMDLADVYGIAKELTVSVGFTETSRPLQIRVTAPFLEYSEDAVFENVSRLSSAGLTLPDGKAADTDRLVPDGESIILKGRLTPSEDLSSAKTTYVRIETDGSSDGTLSVNITYLNGNRKTISGAETVMREGTGTYTMPVTSAGIPVAYELRMEKLTGSEPVELRSVSFSSVPERWELSGHGRLDTVALSEGKVRFKGSVTRDAIKTYPDASVVFYALPAGSAEDTGSLIEIGRIRVSTKFEFTADLSEALAFPETCRYTAALVPAEGGILLIGRPRYASVPSETAPGTTVMGLHDALPGGVFESNVSRVMVDIPLDTLISAKRREDSILLPYTVYSPDGGTETNTAYLSSDAVDQIDRDVRFYISAGIRVYLRFTEAAAGKAVRLNVRDSASSGLFTAAAAFFADRYSSLAGIVLDQKLIADTGGSFAVRGSEAAEACLIMYNIAAVRHPRAVVMLDADEACLDDAAVVTACEIGGNIPWMILCGADGNGEDPERFISAVESISVTAPGLALICSKEPGEENGEALERYASLCQDPGRAGIVFFSMTGTDIKNDYSFYSAFRNSTSLGEFIYEADASAEADLPEDRGYDIWNFTDAFYPLGWIAGGGVSRIYTDYGTVGTGGRGEGRVLVTELDLGSSGGAGMTLCDFGGKRDLSGISELRFDFAVTRPDGEDAGTYADVVFFVGDDTYRAEYYVRNVVFGDAASAVCDLSGYANRDTVTYIGAAIYTDGAVSLELSSVRAYGDEDNGYDAVRRVFDTAQDGNAGGNGKIVRRVTIAGILAVVALAAAFLTLAVRRDRDEKQKQKGERNG